MKDKKIINRLNRLLKELDAEKETFGNQFQHDDLYYFLVEYLSNRKALAFNKNNITRTSSITENETDGRLRISQNIKYEYKSKEKHLTKKKYVLQELTFNKDGTLTFTKKIGRNSVESSVIEIIFKDNTIINRAHTLEDIVPKYPDKKTK